MRGTVTQLTPDIVSAHRQHALDGMARPLGDRVDELNRAADLLEARMESLFSLIVRTGSISVFSRSKSDLSNVIRIYAVVGTRPSTAAFICRARYFE